MHPQKKSPIKLASDAWHSFVYKIGNIILALMFTVFTLARVDPWQCARKRGE